MMQCNMSEVVTRSTRKSSLRPPTDYGEMGVFFCRLSFSVTQHRHIRTPFALLMVEGLHTRRFVYDQETENRTWKGKKREGEKDRFGKRYYMVAPTLSVCVRVCVCVQ